MTRPTLSFNVAPIPGQDELLTDGAIQFLSQLVAVFGPRVDELLRARTTRLNDFRVGKAPDFLASTKQIREAGWTCAPEPEVLADRRVEITGPVDRKMVINGLNSGANVFMADFEDATTPTWENLIEGQRNLRDAVQRTITFDSADKHYSLNEKTAVLFVRPRGLHMPEKHVIYNNKPIPGALFDFGLFVFHNAQPLSEQGLGPFFYLPKLESHLEARLWDDIFAFAEDLFSIKAGTMKATCLIETLPAAFEMDEILYELREHSAGLNCGRWDYIFSYIKKRSHDASALLPDRASVTMDKAFLDAYVTLLIETCHRRGVHAMGGMSAHIPIKKDPARNEKAMSRVRADKLREVTKGHDGTWVAHPALVPIAREVFDDAMPGPNQLHVRSPVAVSKEDLLRPHEGARTWEGLRLNIRVGIRYLEAWLRGQGCVPIYDLMEDAATAEICRAQVWQWLHHGAVMDDGAVIDESRFEAACSEEMVRIGREVGPDAMASGKFAEARDLFMSLSLSPDFEEFLTLPAYDLVTRATRLDGANET